MSWSFDSTSPQRDVTVPVEEEARAAFERDARAVPTRLGKLLLALARMLPRRSR